MGWSKLFDVDLYILFFNENADAEPFALGTVSPHRYDLPSACHVMYRPGWTDSSLQRRYGIIS